MLEITDLKTYYNSPEGPVHAVDGVDIELRENEVLGLLGESGCGKTTLAKSIIQLLPREGYIEHGSIRYDEIDIAELSESEINKQIRWKEISMIPQNAMNGFDPVYTVAEQIIEVIQAHEPKTSKKEAKERGKDLFEKLGIDRYRIDDYPHQFSGGMAQRAMIALSLAVSPSILLADEPTTGLDMIIQRRILELLRDITEERDLSIIMITHDISAAVELCDRIAVMYGGRVVEVADTETILKDPHHPYTMGLNQAFPRFSDTRSELISIPGEPFDPVDPEDACRFAPRCPFAETECWAGQPTPQKVGANHRVECVRTDEKDYMQEEANRKEIWERMKRTSEGQPLAGDSQ